MKVRWGARIVILTDSPSAGVRARAMGRGKSARPVPHQGRSTLRPYRDGTSVAVFTRALLTAFQLRSVHRPGGGTRVRACIHTRGVARYAPTETVSLCLSLSERSLRHFGFAQCIAPLNDREYYASERNILACHHGHCYTHDRFLCVTLNLPKGGSNGSK